jgi:serine protease Do
VTFDRGNRQYLTVIELGPETPDEQPKLAKKAWLGVSTQVITRELGKALGLGRKKGVRVTEVFSDTTAEKAGIKIGDLFLKLDGSVIQASRREDAEVFENLVRQYPADAEVELTGIRDGEELELTVPLQSRPVPSSQYVTHEDENFEFTVRDLAFEDRVSKSLEAAQPGLLIAQVERAGWGALAGLRNGDILLEIDGASVTGLDAFKETMAAIEEKKQERVVFFIKRGIYTAYQELEPNWN